jgi:ubiquinone/menaquinone biosynthesis C-methylase UbiE
MRALVPVLVALLCVPVTTGAQRPAHGRLFPPSDLGNLESPDRDEWQKPDEIMDALRIGEGSRVADLGAGGGWFTIRLARRVGPNGVVYAEDIQPLMIESIQRRVANEGFQNRVVTVLGSADDPRLPSNLDAVLIVDTYPAVGDPVTLLRRVARSLAPTGRLGIVDFKSDGAGGPGPPLDERIQPEIIREHAAEAGLEFLKEETFLRYQFLLVFGKSRTVETPAAARPGPAGR